MNNDDQVMKAALLQHAQALVSELEQGNDKAANEILDELSQIRETELFKEVGKLTRQVHDALVNFEFDHTLEDLASRDIPDAKERLHYVITMTNQAANRTLNAVEEALPGADRLLDQASHLSTQWGRFLRREMNVEDFRAVSLQVKDFLTDSEQQIGSLKNNLNEVLMAQEFQDLTGQIINRVIKLVEEIENSLVNLVRITGGSGKQSNKPLVNEGSVLEGPQVPSCQSASAVAGQDEVDDLLSSLGF